MIEQNKIPEHWKIKPLGEVCDIKNGKNQKQVINPKGKYPIYGSAGVMGFADDYLCEAGATVVGRKGTINKPLYVKAKFWNVDTAFGFCPKENLIDSKFLYFFCLSFNFHSLDKSTTIPSLAKTDLQKINVVVPPIAEQQTIVSKIEELLSDLENGKQQLVTAQQQLKVYRQSLLKWAFEGRLTNKNVNGELPKGWKIQELKEITSILGDGLHGTPHYSETGEYYFINGNNLTDGKIEIKENTKRVTLEEFNKYKKPLNERTIFVSINGSLGYTAFYNNEKVVLGKSACYFNVLETIDKHYIRYYLTSNNFISYATKNATGSTIKNVGLKTMRELQIPMPPTLKEQQRIVDELESKLTVCDKIEETITNSLQQAEMLKQSILKKAFEGKLI